MELTVLGSNQCFKRFDFLGIRLFNCHNDCCLVR